MVELKKEISWGTLVSLLGYIVMVIYFAASLNASQRFFELRLGMLENEIKTMQIRIDQLYQLKGLKD